MQRTILITGATGFIGSRLAMHAHEQQHKVLGFGRADTPAERARLTEFTRAGINVQVGPLENRSLLRDVVAGCETVVHLAAAQHEVDVPDSYFFDVNVAGTRQILEECVAAGVKRFVYASTIGVYASEGRQPLDESSPLGPSNGYERSKAAAETVVRDFAGELSTTIVRIGETYGPGDLRLLKLFSAIHRGRFVMIGAGSNTRQPIHVRDLVRGLLLMTQHPDARGETFVLAGPEVVTTLQMARSIAAALGRAGRIVHVPLTPVWLVARAIELTLKPLGFRTPLTPRRLAFFTRSFEFRTTKAREVLGFEPTISLSNGVLDTAQWYREAGLVGKAPESERTAHSVIKQPPPAKNLAWSPSEILEHTHDAIIIWELGGEGICYWNRAAEQLYGYGREIVRGQTTHSLLKTQLPGGVEHLESSLCRYGVWFGELRHTASDGRPIIVRARLTMLPQHNGRWLVLEVNRDITADQESAEAHSAARSYVSSMSQDSVRT